MYQTPFTKKSYTKVTQNFYDSLQDIFTLQLKCFMISWWPSTTEAEKIDGPSSLNNEEEE